MAQNIYIPDMSYNNAQPKIHRPKVFPTLYASITFQPLSLDYNATPIGADRKFNFLDQSGYVSPPSDKVYLSSFSGTRMKSYHFLIKNL